MEGNRLKTWTITVVIFMTIVVACKAQTNTTTAPQTVDDADTRTSLQKGMQPLYDMTNWFLDLVNPNGIVDFLDAAGIANKSSVDYTKAFENFDFSKLGDDWQKTLNASVGFAACIVVGLLFIIIMPVVGCCFCCFRLCGKCGGTTDPMESKNAKCKRVTFSIIFAIITTLMLGGMVCAFVTNELMREQTSHPDNKTGFLNELSRPMEGIQDYVDQTLKSLNQTTFNSYRDLKDEVLDSLRDAAATAKNQVGNISGAEEILKIAEGLANDATKFKKNLGDVENATIVLSAQSKSLEDQLKTVKESIEQTLTNCPVAVQGQCNNIKSETSNLKTDADYTKLNNSILAEVQDASKKIDDVLNQNISALVSKGREEYDKIQRDTDQEIQDKINETETEVNKFEAELQKQMKQISDQVKKPVDSSVSEFRGTLKDAKPEVDKFGLYVWYAGIGLSCVLLLIVLFNYLGLAFGICGEEPHEDAPTCNRGVGANLLMAGVGFIFIFCSLLMLITMLLFVVGAVSQTLVCRDLTDLDSSLYKVVDDILANQVKLEGIKLSIKDTMKSCKENQPLYTALGLNSSQTFNIKKLVDENRGKVDEQIDKLKTVDLSGVNTNVEILSNETEKQLTDLADAGIQNISYTDYTEETSKALTAIDLNAFAANLTSLANTINTADPGSGVAANLTRDANVLKGIQTNTVDPMKNSVVTLTTSLDVLQENTGISSKVNDLVTKSRKAEQDIKDKGTTTLQKTINDTATKIQGIINKKTDELVNEVEKLGPCKPVYDEYKAVTNAVCVTLLYPFNGFWYSFGWCLFFFIPSIIFAVLLVGEYRKSEPYDPAEKESRRRDFEQGSYDEDYQGMHPGDTVPLEDMSKGRPPMQRGVNNAGYYPEDRGGYPGGGHMGGGPDYPQYGGRGGYGGYPQGNQSQGPPSYNDAYRGGPSYHGRGY